MKKNEHPISFETLEALYLERLADDDRPTCYIAYCRAEAEIERRAGARKLKSYSTFRTMLWRSRQRRKKHLYDTCTVSRH